VLYRTIITINEYVQFVEALEVLHGVLQEDAKLFW
jgi:hypothetical protein